jgi:hypothetical protein
MHHKKIALVVLFSALALASLAAQKFDESAVISSTDRETVSAYLKFLGYSPENVKEKSIRFNLQGYKCYLSVNESDLQAYAWFEGPADPELINKFNSEYRFASAYYDEENDVCVQSDLDFAGGSTLGALKEFIKTFGSLLEDYSSLE